MMAFPGGIASLTFRTHGPLSVSTDTRPTRAMTVAVPSWAPLTLETSDGLDAFRFSDDPVYAALGLAREERS